MYLLIIIKAPITIIKILLKLSVIQYKLLKVFENIKKIVNAKTILFWVQKYLLQCHNNIIFKTSYQENN